MSFRLKLLLLCCLTIIVMVWVAETQQGLEAPATSEEWIHG